METMQFKDGPFVVVRAVMPIKGNALRLARQLIRWWLAGEETITFELLSDRLTVKRSSSAGASGE